MYVQSRVRHVRECERVYGWTCIWYITRSALIRYNSSDREWDGEIASSKRFRELSNLNFICWRIRERLLDNCTISHMYVIESTITLIITLRTFVDARVTIVAMRRRRWFSYLINWRNRWPTLYRSVNRIYTCDGSRYWSERGSFDIYRDNRDKRQSRFRAFRLKSTESSWNPKIFDDYRN